MSTTVVLDTGGLEAWSTQHPSDAVLAVMEVVRRASDGRVVVPSVVAVEALTGGARDAPVNRTLREVDVEVVLTVPTARRAARLRQGTDASAVDAVVAQMAVATDAQSVLTSDPQDLTDLLDGAPTTPSTVVITV